MKRVLKPAFLATVPVLTGYLVLGFGFGIVLKANGYGVILALVMSLAIYAGLAARFPMPLWACWWSTV